MGALSDKTLIILMVAALISIAIGIYEDVTRKEEEGEQHQLGSWVEGIAILVAGSFFLFFFSFFF